MVLDDTTIMYTWHHNLDRHLQTHNLKQESWETITEKAKTSFYVVISVLCMTKTAMKWIGVGMTLLIHRETISLVLEIILVFFGSGSLTLIYIGKLDDDLLPEVKASVRCFKQVICPRAWWLLRRTNYSASRRIITTLEYEP